MKRLFGLTALMLIVSLTVAACGDKSDGGAATTPGGAAEVTVKTSDTFKYDPINVDATVGQAVNLTLDNTGDANSLDHSYVVLNLGVTGEDAANMTPDGDADKKFFTLTVPPGQMATGNFTAPAAPGTYTVACLVAGHVAGGMLGTLTVK